MSGQCQGVCKMNEVKLSIARDFSTTPGGRFQKDGEHSGEEFRIKYLLPKYKEAKKDKSRLVVDLDGCMGYPSSFLDESFGGLAKLFEKENILDSITLISKDQPDLIDDIKGYIANNVKKDK